MRSAVRAIGLVMVLVLAQLWAEIAAPSGQKAFVSLIASYKGRYEVTENPLQKHTLRQERANDLSASLKDRSARGWVGTVIAIRVNGAGKAFLAVDPVGFQHGAKSKGMLQGIVGVSLKVRQSDPQKVQTSQEWNREHAQDDAQFLADNAELYQRVAALKVGDRIEFSGAFFAAGTDYLDSNGIIEFVGLRQGVTEAEAMTDPEFAFRFMGIGPDSSAAVPVAASTERVYGPTGVTNPTIAVPTGCTAPQLVTIKDGLVEKGANLTTTEWEVLNRGSIELIGFIGATGQFNYYPNSGGGRSLRGRVPGLMLLSPPGRGLESVVNGIVGLWQWRPAVCPMMVRYGAPRVVFGRGASDITHPAPDTRPLVANGQAVAMPTDVTAIITFEHTPDGYKTHQQVTIGGWARSVALPYAKVERDELQGCSSLVRVSGPDLQGINRQDGNNGLVCSDRPQ
jgi:hypothetical protein